MSTQLNPFNLINDQLTLQQPVKRSACIESTANASTLPSHNHNLYFLSQTMKTNRWNMPLINTPLQAYPLPRQFKQRCTLRKPSKSAKSKGPSSHKCDKEQELMQKIAQPRPFTGRAEARVDEHRIVHRGPLDGRAAPAELARIASLPGAGVARQRELPLQET
jgi:hypothetical protein